jgi:hypothetical protein
MIGLDSDVEIPKRKPAYITSYGTEFSLSDTLDNMEKGQSFVVDTSEMRKYVLKRARDKGIHTTSQRQIDGRYRIWRTV